MDKNLGPTHLDWDSALLLHLCHRGKRSEVSEVEAVSGVVVYFDQNTTCIVFPFNMPGRSLDQRRPEYRWPAW